VATNAANATGSTSSNNNVGMIVGIVVGIIVLLIIISIAVYFIFIRKTESYTVVTNSSDS
jgi:hypothetical protein